MNKHATLMIMLTVAIFHRAGALEIMNHCMEMEEERTWTESGVFEEDLLFCGHALNFTGDAEDLIFLGKELSFGGTARLGLISLSKKLHFSGHAGNGIIAGGKDIILDGAITGNSFTGGKTVEVTQRASIAGNLFTGGGKIFINGPIDGALYAGAGEIVINSRISGDVFAYGGRIVIEEEGVIEGNLTYSAKEPLRGEERVRGEVRLSKEHQPGGETIFIGPGGTLLKILISLGMAVSLVIVTSLLLFFPAFNRLPLDMKQKEIVHTALWGFVPVLMYPALILVCFALVITIPFALVLILGAPLLFTFATIIGLVFLGKVIAGRFGWNIHSRHRHFYIGVTASLIPAIIPFVNFLWFLCISALGGGVYLSFLFQKRLAPEGADRASAAGEEKL